MFVSAFLISEQFMHFGALLLRGSMAFRKFQSQQSGSAHTGHKEDARGRFFSGNTKEQNIYGQF